MKGIKKMMGLVLLTVIIACSLEANEIEDANENIIVANSTGSESQNEVVEIYIEFAPHVSEPQKNEIRIYLGEINHLLDWQYSEDPRFEIWDVPFSIICPWDNEKNECIIPETPIGTLEDNGDINVCGSAQCG